MYECKTDVYRRLNSTVRSGGSASTSSPSQNKSSQPPAISCVRTWMLAEYGTLHMLQKRSAGGEVHVPACTRRFQQSTTKTAWQGLKPLQFDILTAMRQCNYHWLSGLPPVPLHASSLGQSGVHGPRSICVCCGQTAAAS